MKKLCMLSMMIGLLSHGLCVRAQEVFNEKRLKHYAILGYNIGAVAPFGLPNTIRKVKSYTPLFTPAVGYEATYEISSNWFAGAAIRLDYKGMKVTDSVQYFRTQITVGNDNGEDGVFEGDFTGTNATEARNTYITVPVYAGYHAGKWDFKAGIYAAYLLNASFEGDVSDGYIRKGGSLGEKVLIDHATFDFADKVRSWDFGAHVAVARNIDDRWQVGLRGQVGFLPIFPSSFEGIGYKLHNMFVTVGAAYRIM